MTYTQHPLSAAFPAMSEDDLAALATDIAAHGQREPGVLYEDQVLDGWHRHQACERAGVEFVAVEYTGSDPVAFVISRNAHRRHLTASQRAAAVVMCAEWKPRGKSAPGADLSAKQMAEAAQVGTRTIEQAKAAVRAGLGGAVRDGMMSVRAAEAVAKGEPPKNSAREQRAEPVQRTADKGGTAPPATQDDEDSILDSMRRRISQLNEQVEALSRSDLAAEVRKQMDLRIAIEQRLDDTMATNVRLNAELRAFGKWQMDLFRATGVETRAEVLRIVRTMREAA